MMISGGKEAKEIIFWRLAWCCGLGNQMDRRLLLLLQARSFPTDDAVRLLPRVDVKRNTSIVRKDYCARTKAV